jgi:hypothetical protein
VADAKIAAPHLDHLRELRKAAVAALEAVEAVTSPIDQERGVGFPKGKILGWKTRSRSVGEAAFATSSVVPASTP